MAKLDITLAKDKYDALADELKTYYVATEDGKGYELEGIGSIQRALAEEKAKKATKPELLTEIEELRKFKTDQEAKATEDANKDLEAKGKYEEALAAKEKAYQDRLETETAKSGKILNTLHREQLKTELIKRGVIADRVDYLANEFVEQTEFAMDDNGFKLTKKGGVGDAAEFDTMINEAKTAKPFFFAADGASGSGASGSGNGGGTGKTITRAQYDANPTAYGKQLGAGELSITD